LGALDQTRPLADLTLQAAEGLVLAHGARAEASLDAALEAGIVLLASQQIGLAHGAPPRPGDAVGLSGPHS